MNISNSNNTSYPSAGTAKRVARGAFMDFLGQGIVVLQQILFVPLFLWAWGEALYGEWLILSSLIMYFSLADLGTANFVVNKMTQHYSKGDTKGYAKTFKSALGLYAVVAGVLFAIVAIFALKAPFLNWFGISMANEWSVRFAALIFGAYILSGPLFSLINNLYISVGEYARFRFLNNIRSLLLIGFVALALFLGSGFVGVASWYLILILAFAIFVWIDVKKRYLHIELKGTKTNWKLARSFIVPGLVFTLIPLANAIKIQGSVLIIGSTLGAVAVAGFSVHRTVANLVSRIPSIIMPAFHPEVAVDEARGNYEKLRLMHNVVIKTTMFLTVSAVVFLFFIGEGIINVWTSGRIAFNPALWLVFLAGVPLYSLWHMSSIFQVATNKYNQYATIRVVSAVLGLILALVFVKFWGVVGVIAGFVLIEVLLNTWIVPYKTMSIIRGSFKRFLRALAKGIVLLLIVQVPIVFLIDSGITNMWLKAVIMGAFVLTAGAVVTYYLWFNEKERRVVSGLLREHLIPLLKRFGVQN